MLAANPPAVIPHQIFDHMSHIERLKSNRLFKIGFWIFLIGSGPLILLMTAAMLGLTNDPNPNPVGLGIMAMISFWPALGLIALGLIQIYRDGDSDEV